MDNQDPFEASVSALSESVTGLHDEIVGLRSDLNKFVPREELGRRYSSRAELTIRRRSMIFILAFLILLTVQATDIHTEECGPGRRSEKIVQDILTGKVRNQTDFQRSADQGTPKAFCEISFPTHTHSGNNWPSRGNLVGMGMYGALAGAGGLWWYSAIRDAKNEQETQDIAHPEEES